MSCCIDYDDQPSVYREEYKKARKQHKCCECLSCIHIGEKYQHITGLWDGRWQTFKTCEKCADLRDSLNQVICISLGELREEYKEFLNETGIVKYNEVQDKYIYPNNHFRFND